MIKSIRSLREVVRALLRVPANALVASSSNLGFHIDTQLRQTDALYENPTLSAKLYPSTKTGHALKLLEGSEETIEVAGERFPVPPERLMEGYGPSVERYLGSAQEHFSKMKGILSESGFELTEGSIAGLDLGCAAGRLIRHFAPYAKPGKFFGVDVSVAHIAWCQQHLSPTFSFLSTTTFPHLPFADASFDLIYSGSVFTHISDLADMWLMELARILKPGGRIYITLHDRHTVELLRKRYPDFFLTAIADDLDRETGFMHRPFGMVSHRRSAKHAMVFYDRDFVINHWAGFLKVESYTEEAYGFQSAILLSK